MIQQDWERFQELNEMYLLENRMREEEDYWDWEQEQNKLPARIVILTSIKKEEVK